MAKKKTRRLKQPRVYIMDMKVDCYNRSLKRWGEKDVLDYAGCGLHQYTETVFVSEV